MSKFCNLYEEIAERGERLEKARNVQNLMLEAYCAACEEFNEAATAFNEVIQKFNGLQKEAV